jgi:AhpD family alkylhydroperoxidase
MEPRIDFLRVDRGAFKAMLGIENYLRECGIESKLLDLIRLRASQINGCAYCIDMHWKDLKAAGETDQRLYGLDAWQESPYYSDRELAALAEAEEEPEQLRVAENGDPILDQFGEEGFIDCTLRISNLVSSVHEYRFHVAASFHGETVGFDVVILRGIRGSLNPEMTELIPDHVYYDGVKFMRSGSESDRLIMVLAELYGLAREQRQMVDRFSFTAIALHQDDVDMEVEPISIKLFGNDGEDMSEEVYFESFFKLDLPSKLVYWNEKDPEYREPLINALSWL